MLNKTVHEALNAQIKHEIYSSYLYLAMSAHCESKNYSGMAKWLKVQSSEEYGHAMKLFHYVQERGAAVVLQAIDQPPTAFGEPLELFKKVLAHEQQVTTLVTALYELAAKEKDYPSQFMLQWFVTEQVEEEKNVSDIVDQIIRVGDTPVSLMMLDRQLGMRASK
ncbi:MAG: ferritin [Ignavibacteriales bacterium]|nr:ferritin [Ignavibacteriales bacterium]